MSLVLGLVVPGMPHPLMQPKGNPSWQEIRQAYQEAQQKIIDSGAEILVLYSTQWVSALGHQIQVDPSPKGIHRDPTFPELGSIPYEFRMDAAFGESLAQKGQSKNLQIRTIAYDDFPVDIGSIVALKLLNPDNRLPASIVSCNLYADRAEIIRLGKATAEAIEASGKKAAVVAVTCLSNRMHTTPVPDNEDCVSSRADDERNRKLLELFEGGRLKEISQVARTGSDQSSDNTKLQAVWWLSSVMGQHDRYQGQVHAYGPIFGTGCAVVSLLPNPVEAIVHDFEEDNVDVFGGDQELSSVVFSSDDPRTQSPTSDKTEDVVHVAGTAAPKPVGAYPHARRVGNLLYLSGVGPRQPGTDAVPGGPIRNEDGSPREYDIELQTRAVIENVRAILEASGSRLENVIDVQVFLINMDRDFAEYNRVYAEYFSSIQATRTTVAVRAMPTPIAIELKVLALAGEAGSNAD